MAGIKFKVSYNPKNINKIEKSIKDSFIEAANKIKQDIIDAQVIPYKTGATQRSLEVKAVRQSGRLEVQMSTSTPYSKRLYYHPECNFRRDKNANAQARWFDAWIFGSKKDDFQKYFKNSLKKEMNKR